MLYHYNMNLQFERTASESTIREELLPPEPPPHIESSMPLSRVIEGINSSEYDLNSEDLEGLLAANRFLPDAVITQLETQKLKRKTLSIVEILRGIFLGKFILIGLLKATSIVFLFVLPVTLNLLTDEVRKFGSDQQFDREKILWVSVLLLLFTLMQALTDTQYSYQIGKLELKTKAFLMETLYQSAMSRKSSSDQGSDLMTLFSIDVNSIINFFIGFHETWSLVLKLIIGMTLLYLQMRSAVLIGLGTAVVLMVVNFMVANKIGRYYAEYMVHKDDRMELLREFVSFPKQIKYLKWEHLWFDKINAVRRKEFAVTKANKWLDSLCVLFWSLTNTLISTATLWYFVSTTGEDNLEDQNIFTMIYLFSLLTGPLNALPWTITGMLQARTSFKRLDKYLLSAKSFNNFQEQLRTDNFGMYWDQFVVQRATYQWISGAKPSTAQNKVSPAEQEVNFRLQVPELVLQKGKLYFVIGATGSGKSSFLQSIISQMELVEGQTHTKQSFAYVPQHHWIEAGSIRSNVTMGSSTLDFARYVQSIYRSELADDIVQYDDLDQFDVGPEGSKLSGGQKQRVAICRALYNVRDVYLLDDPFSSLDPQVSDKVFKGAIESLLKESKVVVLVLNDAYLSRYADRADKIFLVKQGEVITDPQEVGAYVREISQLDVSTEEPKVVKAKQAKRLENVLQHSFTLPPRKLNLGYNTKKSVTFYLLQLGWSNGITILVSLILMQVSFNVYDTWLNSFLNGDPIFMLDDNFLATIVVITLLDVLVKIMRATSFAYGNLVQASSIFSKLIKRVIFGPAGFFDLEDSGQILSRLSADQNVVDGKFPFELNLLCNNVVNFVGTFAVMITLKWQLVFPTALSVVLFYRLQQQYRPTSLPLKRLDAQTGAALMSQMDDQQKGVQVITAFGVSKQFFGYFTQSLLDNLRVTWTSKCLGLWLQVRLQAVAGFMVMCVLLVTIISVYFPNGGIKLPPSTLQLLLYYSLTKISLFRDLTLSLTTCEQELISYERIYAYMNYNPEQLSEEIDRHQVQLTLTMRDVFLDYQQQPQLYHIQPHRLLTIESYALKGISLAIEAGQMVAFCGRTGSGKSSIMSLIFRLYAPSRGEIALNAETSLDLLSWRKCISVIPQSGFVFKGTILDNLVPQHEAWKLERLNEYLAHIPIELDLNQVLETGGRNISQGKRQVISFLRVLLEDASIICLDEATASVDQAIEDWSMVQLERLCRQHRKSIITISHRLEALKGYDRIYCVEEGVIKEFGTFEELSSRPNSLFSRLRNLN